jgi:hypothetical protein
LFQHGSRLRGALSLAVLAFAVSACSAAPNGSAAIPSGEAANSAARITQSGGGGGGGSTKPPSTVDFIKVAKAEYFDQGGAVELLVSAVSSDVTAHLYLYDPSGVSLGEVQNGRGGKYGGSVFVTTYIPANLTIKSSSGGTVTVATTPFQP